MLNIGDKGTNQTNEQNLRIDLWQDGATQGKKQFDGAWLLLDDHFNVLTNGTYRK